MTQIIQNAVVHELKKAKGERASEVILRNTPLPVSNPLQRLVDAVHGAYSDRTGKSYGGFEPDADTHPAQRHIRRLLERERTANDFLAMSSSLMRLLASKAETEAFSQGGYVLMADTSNGVTRWLLIAVLSDVAGAAINDLLEVVDATHLDLSAMRYAGRINLTEWEAGGERYISFLRGKKSSVAEYFEKFIGVSLLVRPIVETQRMVALIKQFAADNALDDVRRERVLSDAHAFGAECARDKRELDLDALANRVWPEDPQALQRVFAHAEPPLADGFVPDGRSLGGLRKFKAKTATWSLEFDRAAMADHTIRFDSDTRTLTISDIPNDIADRLNEEFARNEEAEEAQPV